MRLRRWITAAAVLGTVGAGLAVAAGTQPAAAASGSRCQPAAIVGIDSAGGLGRTIDSEPHIVGQLAASREIGTGFSDVVLLASDHVADALYATTTSGKLRIYRWETYGEGYEQVAEIGSGWENAKHLIPQGNGVVFVIMKDGSLRWHRFVGGVAAAGSGSQIGSGWAGFGSVASGGNGIVYAATSTGELRWYKASNYLSSTTGFAAAKVVGSGWQIFTRLTGAGDGIVYGIKSDGSLHWYHHTAAQTGTASWATGSGTRVGSGWHAYRAVTVNPQACRAPTAWTAYPAKVGERTCSATTSYGNVAYQICLDYTTDNRSVRSVVFARASVAATVAARVSFASNNGYGGVAYECLSRSFAAGAALACVSPWERLPGPGTMHFATTYPTINGSPRNGLQVPGLAGEITGKVTNASGAGISGVTVHVQPTSADGTDADGRVYGQTDSTGAYRLRHLPPGTYRVCFDPSRVPTSGTGWVRECHGTGGPQGWPVTRDAVTVTGLRSVVTDNVTLTAGAAVSGRVTDTAGNPLTTADVMVHVGEDTYVYVETGSDGVYRVTGLPAGTARVCFSGSRATGGSSDPTGYGSECYDELPEGHTPVPLTAGQTSTGVDGTLAPLT